MSRTFSVAEVAEQTGLTEWAVGDLVRSGRVAHIRVGAKPRPGERDARRIRFTGEQVAALLAAVTVEPTATETVPRRRKRRAS